MVRKKMLCNSTFPTVRVGAVHAPPMADLRCFRRRDCAFFGYELELLDYILASLGCHLAIVQPQPGLPLFCPPLYSHLLSDAPNKSSLSQLLQTGEADMLALTQPIEDRHDVLFSHAVHHYNIFFLSRRPKASTSFHFLASIFRPVVWLCVVGSMVAGAVLRAGTDWRGLGEAAWRVWALCLKQCRVPFLKKSSLPELAALGLAAVVLVFFQAMAQSRLTADVHVRVRVRSFARLVSELEGGRLWVLLERWENATAATCPPGLSLELCGRYRRAVAGGAWRRLPSGNASLRRHAHLDYLDRHEEALAWRAYDKDLFPFSINLEPNVFQAALNVSVVLEESLVAQFYAFPISRHRPDLQTAFNRALVRFYQLKSVLKRRYLKVWKAVWEGRRSVGRQISLVHLTDAFLLYAAGMAGAVVELVLEQRRGNVARIVGLMTGFSSAPRQRASLSSQYSSQYSSHHYSQYYSYQPPTAPVFPSWLQQVSALAGRPLP